MDRRKGTDPACGKNQSLPHFAVFGSRLRVAGSWFFTRFGWFQGAGATTERNQDCGSIATVLLYTTMDSITSPLSISVVQVKMARAALGLGVRDLAKLAKVSANTIARLERGEELRPATMDAVRGALENAGVEFIPQNGGGAGVRLKRPAEKC